MLYGQIQVVPFVCVHRLAVDMFGSAGLLLLEAVKKAQDEYLFDCDQNDHDLLAYEDPGLGPSIVIRRSREVPIRYLYEHNRLDQIDKKVADYERNNQPLHEKINHRQVLHVGILETVLIRDGLDDLL